MNNLTKIAALPTGGGCQSALRPEDRGVERKPAQKLQPWDYLMSEALIRKFVTGPIGKDLAATLSADFARSGSTGAVFASGGIVGKTPDKMLLDIADDGYVMCKSTRGFKTIAAAAQPGEQVEAVSVEPGKGARIAVRPTMTVNFGGPPSDIDAEQFRRGLARLRAAAGRAFWPERCRADLKADAKKDKWWSRKFLGYGPREEEFRDGRLVRVHQPALYDTQARHWPVKVWKHYYALPAEIWKPELLACLPSPASGVLLLRPGQNPDSMPVMVSCERRATPNKDAIRLKPENVIDIARLANLRMWEAYHLARHRPLEAVA